MLPSLQRILAGAVAAASFAVAPALAQSWPSRPVKLIVPYATGGPADVYGRFIAQRLGDQLGQPFVVENRPGAGAVIGTDAVAKSAPDGYTLLLMSNTHTVNETLLQNKPYNLTRDFTGIAPINYSDLVLVAHPKVGAANVQQLVALAKGKPGGLNYASSGNGTPYHMAGELFKSMSGTSIVHVPYKGSSGARTDVLGGQVDLMFDAVTTMAEQVKAGKVKAIATTGRKRSAVLPDVPTVDESGIAGYDATIWLGLLAPKGTPAAVVARLNEAVSRIASQPDVQQAWAQQGATALVMSPAAFDKYMQDDIAKWAKVIQSANIKAE
ncbi:MAG TPA: tripartite tricarboxylate transporter substrate binding protein [Ramlibacter sp.]|jgi:tripartite-type tricarboxylate transporter receptor subunit TctC|uniref:tripartite tricarboxylate transporter substrate binding protein n=1 Tax=Ramlibacter sp. TaxID=1917967 RepID=UPI002D5864D2|nr:tripartite tricarboxylate transporter substrate binding protein [Ramlibacter sp.]HZY19770.1 tripartite tricarboxylate transporter substrate binding protein [Ramlibacter sp.]